MILVNGKPYKGRGKAAIKVNGRPYRRGRKAKQDSGIRRGQQSKRET
jgi:hypothetical protein